MKGLGNLSIGPKSLQVHFKAVEKLRKCSGLVIYSRFKDSSFTAVKGMQNFKLGMLKGHH